MSDEMADWHHQAVGDLIEISCDWENGDILITDEGGSTILVEGRSGDAARLVAALRSIQKPCRAVVFHGPGHQSRTYCEGVGEHTEHYVYARDWEWEGDQPMATDVFDGPELHPLNAGAA